MAENTHTPRFSCINHNGSQTSGACVSNSGAWCMVHGAWCSLKTASIEWAQKKKKAQQPAKQCKLGHRPTTMTPRSRGSWDPELELAKRELGAVGLAYSCAISRLTKHIIFAHFYGNEWIGECLARCIDRCRLGLMDIWLVGWINWIGIGFPTRRSGKMVKMVGKKCRNRWHISFVAAVSLQFSFSRRCCMQMGIRIPHPPLWGRATPSKSPILQEAGAPTSLFFFLFFFFLIFPVVFYLHGNWCMCISCVFLLCAYANMQLSRPGPTLAIERHVCCHLTWHSVSKRTRHRNQQQNLNLNLYLHQRI